MQRKASRPPPTPTEPSWGVELATVVRRRRKSLRLTQLELAELAGCGPDFLYDLERAKPTLRLDKVLEVLRVLGLRLRFDEANPLARPRESVEDFLAGPVGQHFTETVERLRSTARELLELVGSPPKSRAHRR